MKQKLTLLLLALFTTVGAWATDVTVIRSTDAPTTYGSLSGTTFTTNATSGMAGVTIEGITGTTATNFSYGACLALTSTASGTITMTAPSGYKITGYSLTARSNTYSVSYTLTPSDGGDAVTTSTGGVNLTVSGLDAQTASFTYSASSANSFYIPSMTITVVSATANLIDVTYELYESDGTTLVSSVVKEQEENSAIEVPSSLTAPTYYDYATEGTIGTEDCTIKVIRTLKSGYVISLDGLSNSKCYNIRNNRGTWAVGSGATVVNSTVELNLEFSASDTKQQFAFITYEGNVYLYSVGEGKFAYIDGNKLSLTAAVTSAVAASPVTFEASTNSTYMYSEPIIVTVNGSHFGISTGFSPDVYKYQSSGDGGNCAYIIEAGSFDATSALAALANYFHPTNCYDRVEAEVLPFLLDGEGNPSPTIGKPFGLSSSAASSIVTTYMTQLNNKQFSLEEYEAIVAAKNAGIIYPEDGKFYFIKNVSNDKYINVKSAGGIYADADAPVAGSVVKAVIRENKTYFATQGKEFGWCYSTSNKALLDAAGGGKYAHFSEVTVPGQVAFAHCIGNGEGTWAGYLSASYYTVIADNQVAGGSADAAAAQWIFEEAETFAITLNAGGDGFYYATTCLPYDVTLSAACAYTLTLNGAKNGLTMSDAISVVPAGTPIFLRHTEGTVVATIASNAAYVTSPLTTTALTGTYLEKTVTAETDYFLGKANDKVGFYLWDGTTLKANRAYLEATKLNNEPGVKGYALDFEDDATGINEELRMKNEESSIYNLAGQRMNKMQKGINIINGKKILK